MCWSVAVATGYESRGFGLLGVIVPTILGWFRCFLGWGGGGFKWKGLGPESTILT